MSSKRNMNEVGKFVWKIELIIRTHCPGLLAGDFYWNNNFSLYKWRVRRLRARKRRAPLQQLFYLMYAHSKPAEKYKCFLSIAKLFICFVTKSISRVQPPSAYRFHSSTTLSFLHLSDPLKEQDCNHWSCASFKPLATDRCRVQSF